MRIGFVLDDTLDTPDGVQQYVLTVGSWLSSQGHDVHYLVGHTIRSDVSNVHSLTRNWAVKFNGNRMSMPLPASSRRLKQFLAEQSFDVLHVQVPYSPFLAGRLIRLAPAGTAIIGTFHILPYSRLVRFANHCLALLNAQSGRRFDHMLAVSEPAKQFAQTVYRYKSVTVVPNPVRLEQFLSVTSTDISLNIVFLGRLVERKGAQHLLKAIALLRSQAMFTNDFHVHIGGKGELLRQLQAFVTKENLNSIVSFDGFIAEEAKAAYLAQADIAVFPSTSGESFGIVLLEAMSVARGIVLAGDNPGYSSVLTELPQQLFDPTKTREFAILLAHWLQHSTERKLAQSQQTELVKQFDINVIGPRLMEVYSLALQSHHNS